MIYCVFYDGKLIGLANMYSTAKLVLNQYKRQLENPDDSLFKIQQWYISAAADFK